MNWIELPLAPTDEFFVLNNCHIHHNKALVNIVHAADYLILYLPAYTPDHNLIEESFSTCLLFLFVFDSKMKDRFS